MGKEIKCHCYEGYTNEHCDHLRAVGFNQDGSFIALEPFNVSPNGNLTMHIATVEA